MLVGLNDRYNKEIEGFYDGVKLVQKLNAIPFTFDTVLFKKMDLIYSGTTLVIDPKGVLRHVMLGEDLTKRKLLKIIARKE